MTTQNIVTPLLLHHFPNILDRLQSKITDKIGKPVSERKFENNVLTLIFNL